MGTAATLFLRFVLHFSITKRPILALHIDQVDPDVFFAQSGSRVNSVCDLRMVVAGLGLGLIPVQLLQSSPLADQLSVVEINDFSLKMDVWIVQSTRPGNLRQAYELLIDTVLDGLRMSARDV